jgi:coenzyme F420 hydrogenase subunit beta
MKLNRKGEYIPEIKEDKCTGCGLCFSICPGKSVDFRQLEKLVFSDQETMNSQMLGNFREIYLGFSSDPNLRNSASSGGIVSSILSFLLSRQLISGAIVATMDKTHPWKAKTEIARNIKEVYDARQSKYVAIPTNSCLRKTKNVNGKFALVGLPCQIHGLANLAYYASDNLNDNVVVKIGLFCGSNIRVGGTLLLLNKLGSADFHLIEKVEYRGGNSSRSFLVRQANGKIKSVSRNYFDLLYLLYSLPRCSLCIDLTSELADISVGDAPTGIGKGKMGTIITRTKKGDEIVAAAIKDGYIKASKIGSDTVTSSNIPVLISKKRGSYVRMAIRRRRNLQNPSYDCSTIMEPSVLQILYETLQGLIRGRFSSWLLRNSPLRLSLLLANILVIGLSQLSIIAYR